MNTALKATNAGKSSTTSTTKKGKAMPTTTPRKKASAETSTDHPLSNLIPNKAVFFDTYVAREIDGVADMDVFEQAHSMRHNVLLFGPTGAAKTSAVYAYAASKGLPVVNIACNGGIDEDALLGGWRPNPEGGYDFRPGELPLAVMHGAVILFNEVNFMPPKIAAIVYGLLDRRRTLYLAAAAGSDFPTTIKAHPSTLIVADFNPGYAGTRPLNAAFKNRFAFKLNWGYDAAVEEELIGNHELLACCRELRGRADAGDIMTPVSTNLMMEFEELYCDTDLGYDFCVSNFVSSFEEDEQSVIREVMDIYRDRITGYYDSL